MTRKGSEEGGAGAHGVAVVMGGGVVVVVVAMAWWWRWLLWRWACRVVDMLAERKPSFVAFARGSSPEDIR